MTETKGIVVVVSGRDTVAMAEALGKALAAHGQVVVVAATEDLAREEMYFPGDYEPEGVRDFPLAGLFNERPRDMPRSIRRLEPIVVESERFSVPQAQSFYEKHRDHSNKVPRQRATYRARPCK